MAQKQGVSSPSSPGFILRSVREDDRDALVSITIACFDGVSIDQNIEQLFGVIAGCTWEERKSQHVSDDLSANPDGVFVAEVNGEPVRGAALRGLAKRDDTAVATIELAEDKNLPGTYGGSFKDFEPGIVRIEVEGGQVERVLASEGVAGPVDTTVVVEPALADELRHTQCNLPLLVQISASTGGQIVPPTALSEVLQNTDLSPHVEQSVARMPLWNHWAGLWVFIGCLAGEWVIRKWAGLM